MTSRPDPATPLSLAAAERALGMRPSRGNRLRRYLEARERKLGKPGAILLATGARGRSHVRVTLHAIRMHCPELFPGRAEQLERDFTRYMRAMGTRVRELVVEAFAEEVGEHVEPRLVALERAVRALQQAKDSTRLGGG
ncbi:MAG: hypothetical protein IPM35_02585 [Myxococcales bacterium]|nr:hypothetical protein [Myxococcales bacterium]